MRKSVFVFFALLTLVTVIGCGGGDTEKVAAAPAQVDTAPAGGSGSISGSVTYSNGDPDVAISMDADPVCASLHDGEVHTEMVVADAGKLANVFVYVKEGVSGSYAAPGDAKLMEQKGCVYNPHVSGIMVGQKLVIRNSDPTLHNVHALPTKNQEFNQGQPFQDMELERTFDQTEVMIRFKCDVHPWMSSYMAVLDHPFYAVSGADGSFAIEGLAAGEYVLEAWHEELGTQTQSVTVADGEAATAAFSFGGGEAAGM